MGLEGWGQRDPRWERPLDPVQQAVGPDPGGPGDPGTPRTLSRWFPRSLWEEQGPSGHPGPLAQLPIQCLTLGGPSVELQPGSRPSSQATELSHGSPRPWRADGSGSHGAEDRPGRGRPPQDKAGDEAAACEEAGLAGALGPMRGSSRGPQRTPQGSRGA